ncbi:MAG TPA: hypothetical protein VE990_05905 [Acidimicrobiales bacterium]|nr:hypothetical protein [Acidimicrobiales bacterium]
MITALGAGPGAVAATGALATAAAVATNLVLTGTVAERLVRIGFVAVGSTLAVLAASVRQRRHADVGRAARLAVVAQRVMAPPTRAG